MAHLIVENGPAVGTKFELQSPKIVLGRDKDECQIVLNEKIVAATDVVSVSRKHARILREGNRYFLEDNKSRNGTFVNNQSVSASARHPLVSGDKIRICNVAFKFVDDARKPVDVLVPPVPSPTPRAEIVEDEDAEDSESRNILEKVEVTSSGSDAHITISLEAKLTAILEITRNLSKVVSLNEVLPKVLDSLFHIFDQADQGFIGLLDANGELVPRWTKMRRTNDDTIRVSRTIVKRVIEGKEALLYQEGDPSFGLIHSIEAALIRSMICAPLIDSAGETMGLIQINSFDQRRQFKKDDLELLVSVSLQAALSIDHARLYDASLKQQAVERDLKLARDVQLAFLPDLYPEIPGYEFYHHYHPMQQIGGDYYDYIGLPDGRVAVIVADVVGKGVAAAMLMAKFSAEARFCLASEPQADLAVKRLNDRISRLQLNRFVTMVVLFLNPRTHEVVIVNAGHMAPIHRKFDGTLTAPGETVSGLPLGIMEGNEYQATSITLMEGDCLTIYTDGVTDASGKSGDSFSMARLKQHIAKSDGRPSKMGPAIIEAVSKFLDGKPQDDDICLVCLRRMTELDANKQTAELQKEAF